MNKFPPTLKRNFSLNDLRENRKQNDLEASERLARPLSLNINKKLRAPPERKGSVKKWLVSLFSKKKSEKIAKQEADAARLHGLTAYEEKNSTHVLKTQWIGSYEKISIHVANPDPAHSTTKPKGSVVNSPLKFSPITDEDLQNYFKGTLKRQATHSLYLDDKRHDESTKKRTLYITNPDPLSSDEEDDKAARNPIETPAESVERQKESTTRKEELHTTNPDAISLEVVSNKSSFSPIATPTESIGIASVFTRENSTHYIDEPPSRVAFELPRNKNSHIGLKLTHHRHFTYGETISSASNVNASSISKMDQTPRSQHSTVKSRFSKLRSFRKQKNLQSVELEPITVPIETGELRTLKRQIEERFNNEA